MDYNTRRPALPTLSRSVPRLSIIIKDSRFPESKHCLSPSSPSSPRTGRSKGIATVVVMSPRLFSPVGTPKLLSPTSSRRSSDESTTSRRGSRASASMAAAASRRRESIIYRNEREYDSAATAVVERKIASPSSSDNDFRDEDFPSTRSAVGPTVTKVRAYSTTSLKSRRRVAKAASMVIQEQAPITISGHRRRSSIVVVHNCSPSSSAANREFSDMPEESDDDA
ncbi:hypothetical protein DRE_06555 [Drechslerella stenobrocha 248]|uniref:Uncharacterized protein n=1 Tax=Drechslerella stenobrocha 248 TaxID=1043628 RepID=W7HNE0_9PEZI|nr:hypothetical protein DRE_06555 [Drechslerella stenobrocha 248]